MKPRIIVAAMFMLMCFAGVINANEYYGPYTASGMGLDPQVAAANAGDAMDVFVEAFRAASLGPGEEAVVLVTGTDWDMPEYTITFWIQVIPAPL